MILLFHGFTAFAAGDGCNPPGRASDLAPLLHRWEMTDGGLDSAGGAPLAAARGARYTNAGFAVTHRVEHDPEDHWGVLLGTVPWSATWTWEGWLKVETGGDGLTVARFDLPSAEPVALELVVGCERATGDRVELMEVRGDVRTSVAVVERASLDLCRGTWGRLGLALTPSAAATGRFEVAVEHTGGRADLTATGEIPLPIVDHGSLGIRVGAGAAATSDEDAIVRIDEMTLFGGPVDRTAPTRRWCATAATEPLAYLEPFDGPQFGVRGYYLGLAGRAAARSALRHRLVLGVEAQLSRNVQTILQVRTLETRGVAATGSLLSPPQDDGTTSTLRDYNLVLEQAFVARNSNDRRSPFFYAVGRVPLTIGSGITHQNAMGTIDAPPWSPFAINGEDVPDEPATRSDAVSDRVFQTTMDGMVYSLRPTRGLWAGVRGGRHNPWCGGRTIAAPPASAGSGGRDICPVQTQRVYEGAATLSFAHRDLYRSDLPSVVAFAAEGGFRTIDELSFDGWFVSAHTLVVPPRSLGVWYRFSADLAWERQIDSALVPIEVAGSVLGGVAQLDLAHMRASWFILSVGAGSAGRGGGSVMRGLHPDFDVDLVGFEQVVARETARAWTAGSSHLPSLGGVYGGSYLRFGPTIRLSDIAEIPLAVIGEWTTLDLGALRPGLLGVEFDGSIRFHVAGWRLGVSAGCLRPGPKQGDVQGFAGALRLARNL